VATLAAKSRARALRTLCARRGWPLVAFEPAQLAAPHGRLLAPKTIRDGVTVALAGPL
ncbi:cobalamin biosynthesis protein CbiG, partial [Burkholderia multivorans]